MFNGSIDNTYNKYLDEDPSTPGDDLEVDLQEFYEQILPSKN